MGSVLPAPVSRGPPQGHQSESHLEDGLRTTSKIYSFIKSCIEKCATTKEKGNIKDLAPKT